MFPSQRLKISQKNLPDSLESQLLWKYWAFPVRSTFKNFYPLGINSHAGGMTVARPYGLEIDFVRNPISGLASGFFVIILKFIFTHIFETKIHAEKFVDTKKFHFRSPILINHIKDTRFSRHLNSTAHIIYEHIIQIIYLLLYYVNFQPLKSVSSRNVPRCPKGSGSSVFWHRRILRRMNIFLIFQSSL